MIRTFKKWPRPFEAFAAHRREQGLLQMFGNVELWQVRDLNARQFRVVAVLRIDGSTTPLFQGVPVLSIDHQLVFDAARARSQCGIDGLLAKA